MPRSRDSEILDLIYDVAVDPARLEVLLESWENMANDGDGVAEGFAGLDVETHFNRASVLLDRWKHDEEGGIGKFNSVLDRFRKVAAFTVDRTLKVQAVNGAAARALDLGPGDMLSKLPLEEDDLEIFRAEVLKILSESGEETSTLRFHSLAAGRIMIFQIKAGYDPLAGPFAVVVTSETGWPEGFQDLLAQTFALSESEIAVLRGVVECTSLRDIAKQRGRSVETVRAQVRAIMAKTETHSQAELVRMVLTLLDVANTGIGEGAGTPGALLHMLEPRVPRSVRRPDGRRVDYLVLGDENGRPCMFFPTDLGWTRWPARAEAEAKQRGIKVIVPIRGGYGGSDFYAKEADIATEIRQDMLAIMDRERVGQCPVIALGTDSVFAFSLADRMPVRVSAIILCDGMLPLTTPEQYQRMDKWYRFFMSNARYTPHLLPFIVKAGIYLARRIGKEKFFRMVYASSPGDLRIGEDPQVMEAMLCGSEVTLSENHVAHVAYAAESILHVGMEWRAYVERTKGRIPVHFLSGGESQMIVPETLEEFRQEYDWIDFRVYPDIGALLFFREWRDVLDLTEQYL